MNFGAVVYLPEEISSFWVFVGFSLSVTCWAECCFRSLSALMRITPVDAVNLFFCTKIVTFKYNVYRHKMWPAGKFKSKRSSLKQPHWSACCACLCVRTPLLPPAILFVLYPLSLFHPPSFVAASLCTYMSSCFSKTIQQSTFSHKRASFETRFALQSNQWWCSADFGVSGWSKRETFK